MLKVTSEQIATFAARYGLVVTVRHGITTLTKRRSCFLPPQRVEWLGTLMVDTEHRRLPYAAGNRSLKKRLLEAVLR